MRSGTEGQGTSPRLLAMLGGSFALNTALAVLLGLLYRRELILNHRLAETTTRATQSERARSEAQRVLANQAVIRETLESRTEQQGEALTALREEKRQTSKQHRESEKELGEMLRDNEEKSQELIRRHHRIAELQEEVERLAGERDAASELAQARVERVRREYDAELRTERLKRQELQEKLGALDEINALRDRLRRLVDALEEAAVSR